MKTGRAVVAVVHDEIPPEARPDELDTLAQVQAVCAALAELGLEPRPIGVTMNLDRMLSQIRRTKAMLVFNLIESLAGRDRLVAVAPAILAAYGFRMTGNPVDALAITANKLATKRILRAMGTTTAPWVTRHGPADRSGIAAGRWILKSAWDHASLGIDESALINTGDVHQLIEAIVAREKVPGAEFFAERFIDGREFNVSIIETSEGPRVLPLAEIDFSAFPQDKARIVDYRAKWDAGSFEFHHTPRRFLSPGHEPALAERLRRTSLDLWRVFGLRGYARIDYRVAADGTPFVLEINANPCLSPDAGFAAACSAAGMTFSECIRHIVLAAGVVDLVPIQLKLVN